MLGLGKLLTMMSQGIMRERDTGMWTGIGGIVTVTTTEREGAGGQGQDQGHVKGVAEGPDLVTDITGLVLDQGHVTAGGIQGAGKVQGDLVGQDPETAIRVRGRGRIREGELHEKEYPEMWRKKENPETKSLRNLNHLREGTEVQKTEKSQMTGPEMEWSEKESRGFWYQRI